VYSGLMNCSQLSLKAVEAMHRRLSDSSRTPNTTSMPAFLSPQILPDTGFIIMYLCLYLLLLYDPFDSFVWFGIGGR
jgi:hypothetical protein